MRYLFTLFTACLLSFNLSAQIEFGTHIRAQKLTYYELNAYTNEYEEIADIRTSSYFYFDEDSYDYTVEGVRVTGDWEYIGQDEYGNDVFIENNMDVTNINYRDQKIEAYSLYNPDLDRHEILTVLSEIELVE